MLRAVQNHEGSDPRAGAGLAAQIAHAAQVALALLADVGDEHQVAEGIGQIRAKRSISRAMASSAVSPAPLSETPGPCRRPSGPTVNFFVLARCEHGIQMRGEGDVGAVAVLHRVGDDVAGAVDARDAAQRAELCEHPLGAALLEERRGRDAAKLQVLLVDPLLLAHEPGERVAARGPFEPDQQLLSRAAPARRTRRRI